jgi:transmembrane sensor
MNTPMNESAAKARDRLEQEAVAWYARRMSGNMDVGERDRFEQGRAQSPVDDSAYRKIEDLWCMLEAPLIADRSRRRAAKKAVEPSAAGHDEATAVPTIGPAPGKTARDRPTGAARHASSLRRRFGLAAAASLLLAVGIAFFPDYLQYPLADYRTRIGEKTAVRLADGSTVYLNTDTALDVSFEHEERRVALLRGEAEFEVARDSLRPFRVKAGNIVTEALGARFVVRYDGTQGTVTLLDGKVRTGRISPSGESAGAVDLKPGERVAFDQRTLGEIQSVDPASADAWRRGRLIMYPVTLEDVVEEINRYRRGRVTVFSDRLARREINVAIDIRNIDAWLDALGETLPVRLRRAGPTVLPPS